MANFQLRQQLRDGFVEGCSREYNKNFANRGGEVELCKGLADTTLINNKLQLTDCGNNPDCFQALLVRLVGELHPVSPPPSQEGADMIDETTLDAIAELTAALRTLGDVSRPDLLAAISADLRNNLKGIQCENPVIKLLADHFATCGNDVRVDGASPYDELGATQSYISSTGQRVVFGGTRITPPASSSPPPTDFVIRVAFSSAGRQQT